MVRRIHLLLFAALALPLYMSAQPAAAGDPWAGAMNAGDAAKEDHDFDAAISYFKVALKEAEAFGESDIRLLDTLAHLIEACDEADTCEPKDGEAWLDRALKIRAKSVKTSSESADVLDLLATGATYLGRYRDAAVLYGELIELREKLHGPKHKSVARAFADLAWVYYYKEDKTQARNTLNHALALLQDAVPSAPAEYAGMVEESARLYHYQDKPAEAEGEFDRAIQLYSKLWRENDFRFTDALSKIAQATEWWKSPAYAERQYKRVIEIQLRARSKKSEAYYKALTELADFYYRKDRWSDAEATHAAALEVRRLLGKRDLQTAGSLTNLATARMRQRKYPQAVEAAQENLAIRIENADDSDSDVPSAHALLAEIFARSAMHSEADASYTAFAEATRKDRSAWLASVSDSLGEIYAEQGQYARAASKFETAVAIYELNPSYPKAERAEKIMRLAKVYEAMGRNDEASRLQAIAAQIQFAAAMDLLRTGDRAQYALIGLGIFAVVLLVIALIAGIFWIFLARRLDREIARLYEPPPPQPEPPALEVQADPEAPLCDAAFVGLSDPASDLPPPALPVPQPLPVHHYGFLGDGSTIFEIRVRNLLLSLLTLGIYSFWGKARVRRYLCGQIEFFEDRFVFHGTGREMLLGWLKALPALAFIILFPNLLPFFWQTPNAILAAQGAVMGAILLLWPVASAGAYRYRLNRMSWRAIRFSFRGSTWRYLLLYLRGYLLSVLTLGLYTPFFYVRAENFLLNATFFGDARFSFDARGRRLLPRYMCAVPLAIITFGIFWPWYSALRSRYCWAHTTVAGARFRSTVTGGKLLKLWSGNFVLVAFTLGFGISWATARTLRFWSTHLHLTGDPQLEAIRQDAIAASAVGESFADFLGFDFGV